MTHKFTLTVWVTGHCVTLSFNIDDISDDIFPCHLLLLWCVCVQFVYGVIWCWSFRLGVETVYRSPWVRQCTNSAYIAQKLGHTRVTQRLSDSAWFCVRNTFGVWTVFYGHFKIRGYYMHSEDWNIVYELFGLCYHLKGEEKDLIQIMTMFIFRWTVPLISYKINGERLPPLLSSHRQFRDASTACRKRLKCHVTITRSPKAPKKLPLPRPPTVTL